MTKRLKIILSVVVTALTCVIAIVACVIVLTQDGKIQHLQTEGIGLTLTRNKLTFPVLGEDGTLSETTDGTKTDFSDASSENIFGIKGSLVVVPGGKYIAEMEITNDSDERPFVYWLEIRLTGETNALSDQLLVSVNVKDDGRTPYERTLSEGLTFGSVKAPLMRVTESKPSAFTVTVEFKQNSSINNNAQNEFAVFDLVVYAVPYTGGN